jgi:hypothetical protein
MNASAIENGVWYRDHAASGWRFRMWLDDGWELVVYDEGDWHISHQHAPVVSGEELTDAAGKARAIKVHRALTEELE